MAKLDWTRVKFHASQLEYLDSSASAHYQALAAKADLLRDLLGRPTILAGTRGNAGGAAFRRPRTGDAGSYEAWAAPKVAPPLGRGKGRASLGADDEESHRLLAARAAAALDLYDGKTTYRTPLALKIAGSIADLQKRAEALVAGVQDGIAKDLAKADVQTRRKLDQKKMDTINALRALLVGRGPRLI